LFNIKAVASRRKILVLIIIGIAVPVIILTAVFIIARRQETKLEVAVPEVEEVRIDGIPKVSSNYFEKFAEVGIEELKTEGIAETPKVLIDDIVRWPILSADGKEILYFSGKSNVFTSFSLTTKETSTILYQKPKELETIFSVIWSPQKNKPIAGAGQKFFLIDLITQKITSLSQNVYAPVWSPEGNKIAYQYISLFEGKNYIAISDPDGTNWRNIVEIDVAEYEHVQGQVVLNWFPGGQSLLYSFVSTDFGGDPVNKIDIATKESYILDQWGELFDFIFSPHGQKVLYAATPVEAETPQLWVMKADGSGKEFLGIENFAGKCVWKNDNRNIICAVSEDVYNAEGKGSNDIIVQVDTETKGVVQLTALNEEIVLDITDLFLSVDDEELFFVNIDDKLYSLKLPLSIK
jgi:hypothetical protein